MARTAKGVIQTGFAETPRDRRICLLVYRTNGISGELIRGHFWPQAQSAQAAYNRLAQLIAAGYLEVSRMPSPAGVGSGKRFFALGLVGRRVVAEELGVPLSTVARIRPPRSLLYFAHHLGVCRSRLHIERAVELTDGFELQDWVSERDFRAQPHGTVVDQGKRVVIEPDGAFLLAFPYAGEQGYLWIALEYDTGSENATAAIRAKLRHYLLLTCQAEFGQLLTWWVTPNFKRLEQLQRFTREEAERLDQDAGSLWFTTAQLLESTLTAAIQGRIWVTAADANPRSVLSFIAAQASANPPIAGEVGAM